MTAYVAAIDIGGTTVKSALDLGAGQAVVTRRRPTQRDRGAAHVLDVVRQEARELIGEGLERFGVPPAAIGIASLGMIDETSGVAVSSSAVGWADVPLRDIVEQDTGRPVAVTNDLRAAARAEAAVSDDDDFLFVAIGTGIGGALVTGGAVRLGAHQRAGELGHITVAPAGYPCGCGGRGCLEAEASATAIARRFFDRTGGHRTAQQVAEAALLGDPEAYAVWATTTERLADGLCSAATLLDPGALVIGGGVALAGDFLLAPLRSLFAQRFRMPAPPDIRLAGHRDDAARAGAALLAWDLTTKEQS